MPLTREEAWELLCEWTPTLALRRHARAVEETMRAAALRYGPGTEAVEQWGITGLLHDADYDEWPDEHPKRVIAWLRERGEDDIADAVGAHHTGWGVLYDTALKRAILACDEISGFVGACALVRPEGIATMKPKSVMKKLKDKRFAAKVDRHEIAEGARLLEVELRDHVAFVIETLKPHAEELGLTGRSTPTGSE